MKRWTNFAIRPKFIKSIVGTMPYTYAYAKLSECVQCLTMIDCAQYLRDYFHFTLLERQQIVHDQSPWLMNKHRNKIGYKMVDDNEIESKKEKKLTEKFFREIIGNEIQRWHSFLCFLFFCVVSLVLMTLDFRIVTWKRRTANDNNQHDTYL